MIKKRWLPLVVVLTILVGLLPQMVAAQSPNYYTSVILSDITSGAPVVGGTFTTDLSLSIVNNATPQLGVMGADVWIRFDPAILAVDDADDNPANGIQVSISTEFFGGSLAAGDGALEVALPETVLADENGADVPINSTTVPAIAVMEPGTISGQVLRQGTRTDHAGTEVVAYNAGGGVVGTATTQADGSFDLIVPIGGSYLVQAAYNGYLKAQKSSVYVVGAAVDLGTTTILGGDVNNDNNVNILDIVTIISRYGTTGWTSAEPTDINDDGEVNIFDLTIAAGNFGRYGPLAW